MRKISVFILFFLYTSTLNAGILGDVNNDGKVGITEAVYALQVTSGIKSTLSASYVIVWKGSWKTNNVYDKYDAVQYNQSSYICIQSHTSTASTEPPHETYWNILALKGDTGAQGDIGPQGLQGPKGDTGVQEMRQNLEPNPYNPAASGFTDFLTSGPGNWAANYDYDLRGLLGASRYWGSPYHVNVKTFSGLEPNADYTFSAYIKNTVPGPDTVIHMGNKTHTVTNDWQRFSATLTADASGNLVTGFGTWTTSGDFLITQVQLERGSFASTFNTVPTGSMVPAGGIIMWSGAINNIPNGWALCDGRNGTPDLRDRFIVGSGGEYAQYSTGGESQHTLTVSEMPSHDHDINVKKSIASCTNPSPFDDDCFVITPNTALGEYGDTRSTGGGWPHENRPPYYALAFIIRL